MTFPAPILVEESAGYARRDEPVTLGMPLPQGLLSDTDELFLRHPKTGPVALQTQPLAHWPDHSLKWLLLDFQVSVGARGAIELHLSTGPATSGAECVHEITVLQEKGELIVDTGKARFTLNQETFQPFNSVRVGGHEILDPAAGGLSMTDADGWPCRARINAIESETQGPLRSTLKVAGNFTTSRGKVPANFFSRIHFYAGHSHVKIEFTIRNPQAAKHRGGLWDLGDPGSIYFDDLSLHVGFNTSTQGAIEWRSEPSGAAEHTSARDLVIYQDSSGGDNWQSSNHVNRNGEVRHSFKGYRVSSGDRIIKEGLRASPVMTVGDREKQITAAVQNFWQNFPKALEVRDGTLTVRLFPRQYNDLFELQGGEQKTHTLYLSFQAKLAATAAASNGCHFRASGNPGGVSEGLLNKPDLQWIDHPLIARCTPDWYAESGAVPNLVPEPENADSELTRLVACAIAGDNTFFDRREIIDEYGWRNFGELYADHEAVFHQGPQPLVSHYNNQYDAILGFLRQFLGSGDRRWFRLADQLCSHVRDIDIYHTGADRRAYNHGLFWHTNHHLDAATCTHRCFSAAHVDADKRKQYGGGPSPSHLYTSGLLLHYYLTGAVSSYEAVQELATFAEANLALRKSLQQRLRNMAKRAKDSVTNPRHANPTGKTNQVYGLEGPGRASGNVLNTLLDGYTLTGRQRYLRQAEALLRTCIHPRDNIAKRDLLDVENRWMYTIFLQALGKYLDLKTELDATDASFEYARQSLLHYADWMVENEYIYLDKPEKLEYPNETWAAQELRKVQVLQTAAKYGPAEKKVRLHERAKYLFQRAVNMLGEFETRILTRPVILAMSSS